MPVPRRHRLRRHQEAGFSLPLVIIAALMITLGGLALANRSSQGLLGSVYHVFGLQAREAAEIGVNRIIAELNKPRNRGLLRSRLYAATAAGTSPVSLEDPAADQNAYPSANWLWRSDEIDTLYLNNCPGSGQPDATSNGNIGYPSGAAATRPASYAPVYLRPDGSISSSPQGANRSYRLIAVKLPASANLPIFANIDTEAKTTASSMVLVVEGRSLRPDGSTVSSIRLEKTFQVIPKCCGLSFGGAHGAVSYERSGSDGSTVCLNDDTMLGLGLLGGTGQSTGKIDLRGSNELLNPAGVPVNTAYCLADANGSCDISALSNQNINVQLINPRPSDFPPAKSYPGNDSIAADVISKPRPNVTSKSRFTYCLISEEATVDDGADPSITLDANGKKKICRKWAINADATSGIPSNCLAGSPPMEVAMHCKVSLLDYTRSDVVFLTQTRPIRLYFSQSSGPAPGVDGPVIRGGSGNNVMLHCKVYDPATNGCKEPPASIRDLAMFGCNSCGTQDVDLKGTPDALRFFAYFPNGIFTLAGNPIFEGVLWTSKIISLGNVTWVVPGAGLRDVMEYMGYLPPLNSTMRRNPLLFDVVARATNRFRWIGHQ